MQDLYHLRREYNFKLFGVALNQDKEAEVRHFNQSRGIAFPVFLDRNKVLTTKLKMMGGLGFYIFDKQGKMITRKLAIYTPLNMDLESTWYGYASKYLKVPYIPSDQPFLGIKPPLPLFEVHALDGRVINIKEIYQSKPVVIIIFSPNCWHCRDELDFLNSLYSKGDLQGNFELIAISTLGRPVTEQLINNKKFKFPVIIDSNNQILSLFPSFVGPVPVSFVVDRQGRINALHAGFNERLRDVYVMELKKLAGLPNPPLLVKDGYSGEERCGICHEKEHIQWSLTKHSDAFISLVRKGMDDDESCVPCHVTGFGNKGGYTLTAQIRPNYLEGVQCESCHGPGHASCSAFTGSKPVKKQDFEWQKLCLSCHTMEESLNFVFAKRFLKVLHSAAPDLSAMNRTERLKVLRGFRAKKDLFDNPAKYVGALVCKDCHLQEYKHWENTKHATAHRSSRAKDAPHEEMFLYNTIFEDKDGAVAANGHGVQCEACHGPGERHLKDPEAKGHDYIVGLGDECANCVVEQICRRCHSLKFDPDFDFEREIAEVNHSAALPPDK